MGSAIRGNGSVRFTSTLEGKEVAAVLNRKNPGVVSGKIRARFNFTNGNSAFVLFSMLQGPNPLIDSSYHLIVKTGTPSRLLLVKGPISTGTITPIATGSRFFIQLNTDMAAQLEWKIDIKRKRVRLRGYISHCDSSDFGALVKRLEFIDSTDAFLSSIGEGFGFRQNPDLPGLGEVIADDVEVLSEIQVLENNPARIGPS